MKIDGEGRMIRSALTLTAIILAALLAQGGVELSQSDNGSKYVQSNEIQKELINNEVVKYSNKIIIGDLNLNESHETSSHIQIINSTFIGHVNFDNLVFVEPVDFRSSTFCEECNFFGAKFYRDAYFENVQFLKDANFGNSEFNGLGNFVKSKFSSLAIFGEARFSANANFGNTKINEAFFENARFQDNATFSFAEFFKEAKMEEIVFIKDAYFGNSKFLDKALFWNSKFNGRADFHSASFAEEANFNPALFNRTAIFQKAIFLGNANFENSKFLGYADFMGVNFQEDAILWGDYFTKDNLALDGSKFSRFIVRWDDIKNSLLFNEIIFSSLIKNFKDMGRTDDANNCYYEYRSKKQLNDTLSFVIDRASKYTSGYGVKPEFTILWCIGVVLVFGVIFRWKVIEMSKSSKTSRRNSTKGNSSIVCQVWNKMRNTYDIQCLYFSATVFVAAKSENYSPKEGYEYLLTIERIFGWFFFAMFVATMTRTILG